MERSANAGQHSWLHSLGGGIPWKRLGHVRHRLFPKSMLTPFLDAVVGFCWNGIVENI